MVVVVVVMCESVHELQASHNYGVAHLNINSLANTTECHTKKKSKCEAHAHIA